MNKRKTAVKKNVNKASQRKLSVVWIAIIGFCVVLTIGAAALAITIRANTNQPLAAEELEQLLDEAKGLAEQREYESVMDLLMPHSREMTSNVEAIELFADARIQVPDDGNEHIATAIRLYRRVARIDRENIRVAKTLRDIYTGTGETAEARIFAELVHQSAPKDVAAELAYAEAIRADGDSEDAAIRAHGILERSPANLEAATLYIKASMDDQPTEDEIFDKIEALSKVATGISKNQLSLIYAQHVGDTEMISALTASVADAEFASPQQATWIAQQLSAQGESSKAIELLQEQLDRDTGNEVLYDLAYRLMQLANYDELLALLQRSYNPDVAGAEELDALHVFVLHEMQNVADAEPILKRIRSRNTLFSKKMLPLLELLATEQAEAKAILHAATDVIDAYPQSPYAHYYRGIAYEAIAETDLALQMQRFAARLAPGWILPRMRLASLLLDRNDTVTAFAESAMALKINPGFGPAYESVLQVCVRMLGRGETLSDWQRKAIRDSLQPLIDNAQDDNSRITLNAISQRIAGNTIEVDNALKSLLTNETISRENVRLFSMLTENDTLRAEIQTRAEEQFGLPLTQLLSKAVEIARTSGESDGIQFIRDYRVQSEPLDAVSQEILVADLLSIIESKSANANWKAIVDQQADNPTILRLVLSKRAIQDDFALRKKIIARLKSESGDEALGWQVADIRLQLDQDKSDRAAAKIVLRLNELIRTTPASTQLYELLDIAYSRLNQPIKVARSMEKAIKAGVKSPLTFLRAAEAYDQAKEKTHAVRLATKAANLKGTSKAFRQRLSTLLLKLQEFQLAENVMRQDLPVTPEDSDEHFATLSAYAIAATRSGKATDVGPLLEELASKSKRWNELWIDIVRTEGFPADSSADWLDNAARWSDEQGFDARRRISAAWRTIARETKSQADWQRAADALQPIIESATSSDRLVLAGLQTRLGRLDDAATLCRDVAETEEKPQLKLVALNNLGNILIKQNSLDEAQLALQGALDIESNPSVADSLADLFEQLKKDDDALKLLNEKRREFPQNVTLRLRLSRLLMRKGDLDAAGQVVNELLRLQKERSDLRVDDWQQIRLLNEQLMRRRMADAESDATANYSIPASSSSLT